MPTRPSNLSSSIYHPALAGCSYRYFDSDSQERQREEEIFRRLDRMCSPDMSGERESQRHERAA
jgi:hypothetical protein